MTPDETFAALGVAVHELMLRHGLRLADISAVRRYTLHVSDESGGGDIVIEAVSPAQRGFLVDLEAAVVAACSPVVRAEYEAERAAYFARPGAACPTCGETRTWSTFRNTWEACAACSSKSSTSAIGRTGNRA